MRIPIVFAAAEIANWTVAEEIRPGVWRPARNRGFNYWSWEWIKYRFRVCWAVFKGDYDILNWQCTGEKKNTETHYRDCTHPDFILSTDY